MTLLARDEEDILEANLRYHFAQGVDFVVALDNGSIDGTPKILGRYREAGLLHLIEEPSEDFRRNQGPWFTRMARLAATEFGADWVINNDADEFWWPVGQNLKDAFGSIPDRFGVLAAPRPEFVPRPDADGTFAERLVVREAWSHTGPKLAHRALSDVVVFYGSHRVMREPSSAVSGSRHLGRPVLRESGCEYGDDQDGLVLAPQWPIRILHFPLRSYAQFERRVRRLVLHEGVPLEGRRKELHEHLVRGELPRVYAEMVCDDTEVAAGLNAGALVRDTTFRDYLAGCLDPVEHGAREARERRAPVLSARERENELAGVQEDMMRAFRRTEHTLLEQRFRARQRARKRERQLRAARQRVTALRHRTQELSQQLAAVEGSRPVGLRSAIARLVGRSANSADGS